MSFLTFWRGRNEKGSFDRDILGFDLLYQLSYMSAIAASGASRGKLFELGAQLPCPAARYFKDIVQLSKKMNYDYSESCRIVGERAKDEGVRSLLLRLSSSLASGEQPMDFFKQETAIQAENYANDYEQKLESLRKWTDAFTALIISAALIIVVAAISMLIYKVSFLFVLILMAGTIAVGIVGAWVVHRSAPKELKAPPVEGCKRLDRANSLFKILCPMALVFPVFFLAAGLPVGLTLVLGAALLFPVGMASLLYDRDRDRKDGEISTFLRTLGNVGTAIGTTITEALDRIDFRSMASLKPEVKKLRTRLFARIRPDLCWRRFVADTGSPLIGYSVRMFQDATNLGGEAEEVGARSSVLAMRVTSLRAKRRIVSSPFGYLCIVMHAVVALLLLFISEVIGIFGSTIGTIDVEGAMASSVGILNFNPAGLHLFDLVLVVVLLAMCVINAFAAMAADGGYKYKFFFYLSGTLGTTGLAFLLVPRMTGMMFDFTPAM